MRGCSEPFDRRVVEEWIGQEYLGEYDMDAIIDEITWVSPNGTRYWKNDFDWKQCVMSHWYDIIADRYC